MPLTLSRRSRVAVGVLLGSLLPAAVTAIATSQMGGTAAATGMYLVAVTITAILAGRTAGHFATAASVLLMWWYLIEPVHSFELRDDGSGLVIGVLGACGISVTLLVDLLERSRRAAELDATRVRSLQTLTLGLADLGPADDLELACAELGSVATGAAWLEVRLTDGDEPVGRHGRQEEPDDSVIEIETEVPIAGRGVRPALFRFGFDQPVDAATRSVASASAQQCTATLERLLYRRAEHLAAEEQELIAKAATLLSASPDSDAVRSALDELVVPDLADTCEVHLRGSRLSPLPADATAATPTIVLPLVTRDEVLGDLVLTRRLGFDPIRRVLAASLAELVAQALDRALLFEEQSSTSLTLQRSLLPQALLQVPGLEVAARYVAAGERTEVGGDFYDAVRHDDGRITLIIGDVQGKGIEAATLNALARQTLRALAMVGRSPSAMLRGLNEALRYTQLEHAAAGDTDPLRLVTAAVVQLRRQGDRFTGVASCGGHPPPLIVRADGVTERPPSIGTVLGLMPEPDLVEAPVELRLADTLVLYTDGVTDVHNGERFFGDEDLARLIRNRLDATTAEAVAELVETTVRSVAVKQPRDDIAVVVARVSRTTS